MAFYNEWGKKIQQTGQTAIDKTKKTAEVARLNSEINSLEKDIDVAYTDLGKAYFEKNASNVEDPDMVPYFKAISDKMDQIQECRDEITKLKGITKCVQCGMEIDEDAKFCHYCGARQVPEVNISDEAESEEETIPVCANCGAPLEKDAVFCSNCGKKVEKEDAAPEPVADEEESEEAVSEEETGPVCANCGAPLEEDAVFCSNCGQKIEN